MTAGARRARGFALAGALIAGLLLSGCATHQNRLAAVKASGELVVLTRNSPTTYYEGPDGPAGIEYDMAKAFADYLGVQLRIKVLPSAHDVITHIAAGKGDVAAAGLTITAARLQQVRFTPPYQQIWQQVVYRVGSGRPRSVSDLIGQPLEVVGDSSYDSLLLGLKQHYPTLTWTDSHNTEVEGLLHRVHAGKLRFTIADSNVVAMDRQYYPDLGVAFNFPAPRLLAWAFPRGQDRSLFDAATSFFKDLRKSGELDDLIQRYYAPVQRINPFNLAVFISHIGDTLPLYEPMFQRAGLRYSLDWRLLAAMGYQESLWHPRAESPTGVQGLMMLTNDTSLYVGIHNRLDPAESVDGGAKYLRHIINRLDPQILQPDRTWMALAAYNMGIHHLNDARRLTARQGGNPNLWKDVVLRLPMLAQPRYYGSLKYGYAPGYQAVQYVNRIRTYYNVLTKIEQDSKLESESMLLKLKAPAI
ncbi:MAG TPA: membrane-bound lytic murein transglycosylase MltF [Acidiferrobacteraceae bacterium]|nr:membrane-bound lytic murein transglycosylase MltF [Acidiferrobacteraceae bacterium]